MKDVLVAGDTLDFVTSVPDYLPSAGYTLKYRLIPRTSGSAIVLTATTSGEDYRVTVAPATTANWASGEYSWSAWVEKTGERHTVDSGILRVDDDPGVVAAYDGRTDARKILDSLMALYVSHSAGNGLASEYTIAGRSMKFRSVADLLGQIDYWKRQVADEDRAAKIAAGLDAGNSLRVRF